VFFGFDALTINAWPLMVLDWSLSRFDELTKWAPQVSQRVRSLTQECGALDPTDSIYIEPDGIGSSLASAFHEAGHDEIEETPPPLAKLMLQERAIGSSAYVARGLVITTAPAYEKECTFQSITRNHLLAQITSFGISAEDPESSELFSAWCLGILLALESPPRK